MSTKLDRDDILSFVCRFGLSRCNRAVMLGVVARFDWMTLTLFQPEVCPPHIWSERL